MKLEGSFAACLKAFGDTAASRPGDAEPSLRRAVQARAAALSGGSATISDGLPEVLTNYVDKVTLNAYKVTDHDVSALKQAGYSEDAVFEVTVNAALGAGLGRFERFTAVWKGG
jgi:hypothetical protein